MLKEKINSILNEKRCLSNIETERRHYFIILKTTDEKHKLKESPIDSYKQVETGEVKGHILFYNKEKDEWVCSCLYNTLKFQTCSRIATAMLVRGIGNGKKEV